MVLISLQAHDVQFHFHKSEQGVGQKICVLRYGERHIFCKGHRPEQSAALIEHAYFSQDLLQGHGISLGDIIPVDDDLTSIGAVETYEVLKERAFPAATPSKNDKNLSLEDIKRDAFKDGLFAISGNQVTNLDNWCYGRILQRV